MNRIFLCHANEDKPQVREVYDRLQATGFKPWLDEKDILPGEEPNDVIQHAIETCEFVLVFLSTRSVEKVGYVQREFHRILERWEHMPQGRIHTIPVKLDACESPQRFRHLHWADLSSPGGFDRILASLHRGMEQRGLAMPEPVAAKSKGTDTTRVYISSTYFDLIEYREKVYEELRALEYDVCEMEDYGATEERRLDPCLQDVARSHIYIGIIAWRYGYIPKHDPENQTSITELEYAQAGAHHIPRLIFLLDDNHPWPPRLQDSNAPDGDGGATIRAFRSRLQDVSITGFFTTPDNLAEQIREAIANLEMHSPPLDSDLSPQAHHGRVIDQIAALLSELSPERQGEIADHMYALVHHTGAEGAPSPSSAVMAHDLAVCMVDRLPVMEVVGRLMRLMAGANRTASRCIADMVEVLLPFKYIPEVVATLRDQVAEGGCGWVENEVTTWSLAEILMAGYEQKATSFHVRTTGALRGQTAQDYGEGPPVVGPGNQSAEVSGRRYAVRDTLVDLLSSLNATPQRMGSPDVEADIAEYAKRLQEVLDARRDFNRDERHTYFVLTLPDDEVQRDLLKAVLDDVGREVQNLFFIELARHQKHEGESRIDQYLLHIIQQIRSEEDL